MAKKLFQNEILVYTKVLPQLTHIGYYPKWVRRWMGSCDDKMSYRTCSLQVLLWESGRQGMLVGAGRFRCGRLANGAHAGQSITGTHSPGRYRWGQPHTYKWTGILILSHSLFHTPTQHTTANLLTRAAVNSSVKYLGKFHGNCYAMKEWNNDAFQDIVSQLSKTRFEQVTTGQPSYDEYTRLTPKRGISAVRNRYSATAEEEWMDYICTVHLFCIHRHSAHLFSASIKPSSLLSSPRDHHKSSAAEEFN